MEPRALCVLGKRSAANFILGYASLSLCRYSYDNT